MAITKLNQMFDELKSRESKRLVAAWAVDNHTIEAVSEAVDKGIVDGILVGDKLQIEKVCQEENIDINKFNIVDCKTDSASAAKAVELINAGEGDILMKGLVSTDKYMRAILNKENGLMPEKAVLSHVTVIENPKYHKLMVVGDVAVIPAPELKEKIAITNYLVNMARALGIDKPKVAVITATEQVLPKMQSSVDATILAKMAERGQIKNCTIDGPLALDVAIDQEAAQIKKITGDVAGNADCLLFPNIEAGNVFYKTNTKLSEANLGAVVAGAKAPAILSSRGDSSQTKLYSIALGALLANL